jgi:hypothetical protein
VEKLVGLREPVDDNVGSSNLPLLLMVSQSDGYCTSSQLAEALANEMFNAGCASEVINKLLVFLLATFWIKKKLKKKKHFM